MHLRASFLTLIHSSEVMKKRVFVKIQRRLCSESFGIFCAEMVGLSHFIIDSAEIQATLLHKWECL